MAEHGGPRIDAARFERLVAETMDVGDMPFRLVTLEHGLAEVVLPPSERFRRAGGTVSGPTLFALADLALYAACLSVLGPQPLAVTTDMTIHFLRRPPLAELRARAEILKAGRTLMVGAIEIRSAAREGVVAHATGTYAVPPGASAVGAGNGGSLPGAAHGLDR